MSLQVWDTTHQGAAWRTFKQSWRERTPGRNIVAHIRRRLIGIVERAALGGAMSLVLILLERRLSRPRDRRRGHR